MVKCPICSVEHKHFHIDRFTSLEQHVKWCPKHCIMCKLEEDEANDASS